MSQKRAHDYSDIYLSDKDIWDAYLAEMKRRCKRSTVIKKADGKRLAIKSAKDRKVQREIDKLKLKIKKLEGDKK